jgi:hypothetical protein
MAFAKKHGVVAVDDARAAALDLGVENYRFVRRYLERHPPALSAPRRSPDPGTVRIYRDLINLRTKDNEKEQENESD